MEAPSGGGHSGGEANRRTAFPTAESVAINRERLRMIQKTMPTLSSGEQQTLLLELEGLSHKEAANRLETTLGTIRYWRCIGIKKLASLLRVA